MSQDLIDAPPQPEVARGVPVAVLWIVSVVVVLVLIASGLPGVAVWAIIGVALGVVGPFLGIGVMIGVLVKRMRVRGQVPLVDPAPVLPDEPAAVRRQVDSRIAGNASLFRTWRQTLLLTAHVTLIAVGILGLAILGGWRDSAGYAVFLFLTSSAALGLLVVVTAPIWMFGRSVFAGEQHALVTRTGAWRLIRLHRVLAWIVGIAACAASLVALFLYSGFLDLFGELSS